MTEKKSLSYIEMDIQFCSLTYGTAPCTASIPTTGDIKCFNSKRTCQDTANFTTSTVALRFAKQTDYLPDDIDCIPSISEISYTPATISLGENLGIRATLSVTFKDHPHSDTGTGYDKYLADRTYDPFSQGTYWGKFRARQPFLRGQEVRWITGLLGDALADMETRYFVVDSFDGPTPDGKFTIIAKDILKLADGDRAQCPVLSNGYLSADITAIQTTATLLPSGIGNAEYPASGLICIGGNEVVSFTRAADVLTIARAVVGTTASTHKAQDRCQLVKSFVGADVANIIHDLLANFAAVPESYMPYLTDWAAEVAAYSGVVYTSYICEPTPVTTLVAELIEQAALATWDDNLAQQLRLQVLRGVVTDADTFTPEKYVAGTLTLKDQPEKRLSKVQVYFGRKDPTKPLSNLDNYRSTSETSLTADEEAGYGSPSIKKIYSRWIAEGGRATADALGAKLLARYRDPPRRITFSTMQEANTDVELGQGYRLQSFCSQDATGAQSDIPIQVTRLNPTPPYFAVEAEEMLYTAPDDVLADRLVTLEADSNNFNLRTAHDNLYPVAVSGDVVTCTINTGVTIGSSSTALPAFDVGSWAVGVVVNVVVNGRIQGRGGDGGLGGTAAAGSAAQVGGPALYTRRAINLSSGAGEIWGGGGGGGGGAGTFHGDGGGGGGGGGAGTNGGLGVAGGTGSLGNGFGGTSGSRNGVGFGGAGGSGTAAGVGGNGGGPGLAGSSGGSSDLYAGGIYGLPGAAIDGASYVTPITTGDIRGGQIN